MFNLSKTLTYLFSLFLLVFTIGCNEDTSILEVDSNSTDQAALEKIVENDETLESFDLNYNEEDAMDFVFGKVSTELFPIKVGQRMKLIDKNLNLSIEDDMAYGTLTSTFEGVLFIMASEDSLNGNWQNLDLDIYEKPFTTTIQRNLIFTKVGNSEVPDSNWRLTSVSLPVGGTLSENIEIEKMIVYLPSGDTLTITDPLEYYLSLGLTFEHHGIPTITQFETVEVEVYLKSVYENSDYVTLTYGALRDRANLRAKRRLELVNEEFDGSFYNRVYKGEWVVNQYIGKRHAIINAFPYGVIKDSEAPVESNSWGIPYAVR